MSNATAKRLLLVLVPVLAVVLVVLVPRTLDRLNAAPAQPAPGPLVAPAAEAAPAAVLAESDVPPEAGQHKLVSFGRFVARDPFRQVVQAEKKQDPAAPPAADTAQPQPAAPDGGATLEPVAQPTAVLEVNGTRESVAQGESFPAADPTFTLARVEDGKVAIGLVGGAYSTGAQTLDLAVGDSVTLVAQPDGARYELRLVSVSS